MKIKTCYYQEFDPEKYIGYIVEYYIYPRENGHRKFNFSWYEDSEILDDLDEFWSDILLENRYVNEVSEEILTQLKQWTIDNYGILNKQAVLRQEYIDQEDEWRYDRENMFRKIALEKYSNPNYKAPKNAKEVIYKGRTYKSKAQCCAIENITLTQLNNYLK